jgi:hypothetical protein
VTLTYRSSTPERFAIVGTDTDGSRRVATATRVPGSQARWDLQLEHPSGRAWRGVFNGPNVLDALGQLLNDKDVEYKQERTRGHKPEPQMRDLNQSLPDTGEFAPIVRYDRDNRR